MIYLALVMMLASLAYAVYWARGLGRGEHDKALGDFATALAELRSTVEVAWRRDLDRLALWLSRRA